ncbi:MAG TPA: ParB/RepB/Spo0J family partition protein [Candidatus Paceibacterota bacterium]|nr:ParB/RepB/Spo0J family partition protein [Candidatus Paceibacterota bacterium]
MSQFQNDSIFWIELDKIRPNPFQPRREFDQAALQSLADSIKQYGVLQALVVTRKEEQRADGGIIAYYELIAGERRLRASKLAGLSQVPVLIKTGEENDLLKLELAIIENIQREDLNPLDRARAFLRLAEEFGFKHSEIGAKVGKSREYVTNTLRMLSLPEHILEALAQGKITEGHTRPLMMLVNHPQEQDTLLKEIMYKKLTVREAELIARRIAKERVRKKEYAFDPELVEIEEKLQESLGTRVQIERREQGGNVVISFFSNDDLRALLEVLDSHTDKPKKVTEMLDRYIAAQQSSQSDQPAESSPASSDISVSTASAAVVTVSTEPEIAPEESGPIDDRTREEIKEQEDEDIYSIKNFSI